MCPPPRRIPLRFDPAKDRAQGGDRVILRDPSATRTIASEPEPSHKKSPDGPNKAQKPV